MKCLGPHCKPGLVCKKRPMSGVPDLDLKDGLKKVRTTHEKQSKQEKENVQRPRGEQVTL